MGGGGGKDCGEWGSPPPPGINRGTPTMQFPFTYEIDIAADWTCGEVDGALTIEANPDIRPGSDMPDWTVEEVTVKCLRWKAGTGKRVIEKTSLALPDDHWLHDRLLADVLGRNRGAIDLAWGEHMRGLQAAARAGFGAGVSMGPLGPVVGGAE